MSAATLIQRVLRASGLGLYLPNADVGAVAASALTCVKFFRRGSYGDGEFRDKRTMIWRPGAATAADYYRSAALLTPSTGVLAPDAAWADITLGTEDFYLVYYDVHPQLLVDAANRMLRNLYFPNAEPLSAKPSGTTVGDSGFQSTVTTAYTESDADAGPATTFSKITTADSDNVWGGSIASGRILNAAANGYIRQRFNVTRGEQVFVWVLVRADVGTASLTLWDVTNNVEIGTAVTTTEEQWQYMWRTVNVPSTCEVMEIRLQGVGATDDIYWGGKGVYRTQNRRIQLDSTWDTGFKLGLMYGQLHGSGNTNGVVDAHSIDFTEIPRGDDTWVPDMTPPGANPRWIQFHTSRFFNGPIWIEGRRAHADVDGPFTEVLTQTTSLDLDLAEAATRIELFEDGEVKRKVPDAVALRRAAYTDFKDKAPQFIAEGPAKRKPAWIRSRLGN